MVLRRRRRPGRSEAAPPHVDGEVGEDADATGPGTSASEQPDVANDPDAADRATASFQDELEALGFRAHGESRRGGRMWALQFNRFLTFVLHAYDDAALLTWSFDLGEFADERGWRSSVTDLTAAEIYPKHDVRLPLDVDAVGAEITRTLASLRMDLGDPQL